MEPLSPGPARRTKRALATLVALGTALCASLAAGGCGGDSAAGTSPASRPPLAHAADLKPFPFFSPSSFWNSPPPASAPIDPSSGKLIAALNAEIARELAAGNGPWINTIDYSVPIYTVPEDQPTVRVHLASEYYAPALRSAWRQVPLPPGARPAGGSDRTLVVWQPSTDRLWEFWKLRVWDIGWAASWGGAIRNVSSNWGAYGPGAWPEASTTWGASASSLSIAGGLITLKDLQRGRIDHALAIAIPNTRAGVYASPARRTDGTSYSPASLPEGARLRLDPDLDIAALRLPWIVSLIAEAAQRHGIFVRDKAKVAHFFAQDPRPTGTNPYLGETGYFEGSSPAQLLSQFPWQHLQVLRMELHEFDPVAPRRSR